MTTANDSDDGHDKDEEGWLRVPQLQQQEDDIATNWWIDTNITMRQQHHPCHQHCRWHCCGLAVVINYYAVTKPIRK